MPRFLSMRRRLLSVRSVFGPVATARVVFVPRSCSAKLSTELSHPQRKTDKPRDGGRKGMFTVKYYRSHSADPR